MKKKRRKPLTLDKVWKLCLAQWDYIIEQRKDRCASVIELKEEWVRRSEYKNEHIENSCFFCERNERQKDAGCCKHCPGVLVSPRFNCQNTAYSYCCEPEKFYAKLQRMYKKYKAQKGK